MEKGSIVDLDKVLHLATQETIMIEDFLCTPDGKTLIKCSDEKSGVAIIPEGIESIGPKAFCNSRINKVITPKSLKNIYASAFSGCKYLTDIRLNNGLESIGDNCFFGCISLEKINIPAGIECISYGCFSYCPLTDVELPDGILIIQANAFNITSGKICLPSSLALIEGHNFTRAKSVRVTGKIPRGLFRALMTNDQYMSTPVVEIYVEDKVVCMPKVTMTYNIIKYINELEQLRIDEIIRRSPYLSLLPFVREDQKEAATLTVYEKTDDIRVKSMLAKLGEKYANRLIKEDNEEELIRLIKANVLKASFSKKLLKKAQDKDLTVVKAYLLKSKALEDKDSSKGEDAFTEFDL